MTKTIIAIDDIVGSATKTHLRVVNVDLPEFVTVELVNKTGGLAFNAEICLCVRDDLGAYYHDIYVTSGKELGDAVSAKLVRLLPARKLFKLMDVKVPAVLPAFEEILGPTFNAVFIPR